MSKTRTFAFLDLDGTLIDSNADHLNKTLLEELLAAGITDLCLFTSMTQSQIRSDLVNESKYTRPSLIDELKAMGFTVHKVITPPDLYQEGKLRAPGSYYEHRWKPAFNEAEKRLKKITDPNQKTSTIDSVIEEKQVDKQMKDYQVSQSTKCDALVAQGKQAEADTWQKMHMETKAEMYQLALDNIDSIPLKGKIGSIVYFEDKASELGAVSRENKKRDNPILLSCIEVRTRNSAIGQKADLDDKADSAEVRKRYKAALKEHTDKFELGIKDTLFSITHETRKAMLEEVELLDKKEQWHAQQSSSPKRPTLDVPSSSKPGAETKQRRTVDMPHEPPPAPPKDKEKQRKTIDVPPSEPPPKPGTVAAKPTSPPPRPSKPPSPSRPSSALPAWPVETSKPDPVDPPAPSTPPPSPPRPASAAPELPKSTAQPTARPLPKPGMFTRPKEVPKVDTKEEPKKGPGQDGKK